MTKKNLSHAREKNLMIQAKANTVESIRLSAFKPTALCKRKKKRKKKKKITKRKEKHLVKVVDLRQRWCWMANSSNRHDAPPLLIGFATLGVSMLRRRFAALVRKHHTSKASLRSGNLQAKRKKHPLCQKKTKKIQSLQV